jgi:pSer/pThr/pTyr-binding forkhead associated (FHA) protein
MIVKLVVQVGRKRGKVLTLRRTEAVLGRGPGNAVRIPSGEVSRKHCRLSVKDGAVTVEDLDSLNGTYVNDERINGIQVVHSGDLLKVGPMRFVVEYDEEEPVLDIVPVAELDESEEEGGHADEYDVELDEHPAGKEKKHSASGRKATQVQNPNALGKTMPPEEEVPVLPLASEDDAAPSDQVFLVDDQAWELPDPDKLRDILQDLDKSEAGEGDS